jgi:hypothetical protein
MPATSLASIFDIGADILGSERNDTNGSISVQIGDAVGQEVRCDNASWWQHVGFASRPAKAQDSKSAAQVIAIEMGDRDICLASRDIRGQGIYGSLETGETCIYAGGPNNTGCGRILLKDDGSVSTLSLLTQKGNTQNGNPIIVQLSSSGQITLANEDKGTIVLDQEGIKIATTGQVQIGASGPVALIGSSMALNAGAVSLGANAQEGIMLSTQLLAWIAQVNTALTVIAGAAGLTPNPTIVAPTAVPVASNSVKAAS